MLLMTEGWELIKLAANQHCPKAKLDPAHHRKTCCSTCPWRRCRTAGIGLKILLNKDEALRTWLS
jgi:hypothetical protein